MNTAENLLTSDHYPILPFVFSNLSAKQLCIASQVCSTWNKEAQRELDRRRTWNGRLFDDDIDTSCRTYFNQIPTIPSFVISLSQCEHHNQLRSALPKNCCTIMAKVDGAIGRKINQQKSHEIEQDVDALSLLCLKTSNNLRYKTFSLDGDEIKSIRKKQSSFFSAIDFNVCNLQNGVIYVIAKKLNDKVIGDLIGSIKKDINGKNVVVLGGQCRKLQFNSVEKKVVGFILHGEHLRPYLHVHETNSEQELETFLTELKEKTKAQKAAIKQSLMLMVSCIGRGEKWYERTNVECDIINKVFPGLQVFGFFGLGEIAYDSSSECTNCKCALTYASVFCLLQFL